MTDIRTKALAAALENAVLMEIYDVAYTLLNLTDKDLKQTQELRQMLTECGEALLKIGKFLEKNFVAAYYLKKALEELVYLKDHLKHVDPTEYERRKPLAWEAAREALAKARGEGDGMNWEALFWGIIGGNVAVITAIIAQWLGWRQAMKKWQKARGEGDY